MTIKDLMKNLATLFPKQFEGQEVVDSWASVYRDALGRYEGPKLAEAFEECMKTWRYNAPPKPVQIAEHIKHGTARHPGADPKFNPLDFGLPTAVQKIGGHYRVVVRNYEYGWMDALRFRSAKRGGFDLAPHEQEVVNAWGLK